MIDIEKIKKFMEEYVDEFKELTKDLPRQERIGGISRSEAFGFCALGKFFDIDLVIDSGTGKGISGEYFSRVFDHIYTIDRHTHYEDSEQISKERLSGYNVTFIKGNAFEHIPELLKKPHKKAGIFFDGPKCENALNVFKKSKVVFAGFHDTIPDRKFHNMIRNQDNHLFNTRIGWFFEKYNILNTKQCTQGFPDGPGASFLYKG